MHTPIRQIKFIGRQGLFRNQIALRLVVTSRVTSELREIPDQSIAEYAFLCPNEGSKGG